MNVLVRGTKQYKRVAITNETQYQEVVKQQLSRVLPDFFVIWFTPFVVGDEGIRRRPDLALIDRQFRTWFVIEVELSHHSLHGHIIPQVLAFSTGRYNKAHAQYISRALPTCKPDVIYEMIRYSHPEVIVVVESFRALDSGWDILEKECNARLMFLEIFRSSDGDAVFYLRGFEPVVRQQSLAFFQKHPILNALVCRDFRAVPTPTTKTLNIFVDDALYECAVITTRDELLLFVQPDLSLRDQQNYELIRDSSGRLVLKPL